MGGMIDKDEAVRTLVWIWNDNDGDTAMQMGIDAIRKMERPKGVWHTTHGEYELVCSVCRKKTWFTGRNSYRFCPRCGAEMRMKNE